jgi:hypothetical protein
MEQEGNRMNRESERKRLVELISDTRDLCPVKVAMKQGKRITCDGCKYEYSFDCHMERVADKLLDDGWMRPPVKVGQTVYIVAQISQIIVETKVIGVWTYGDRCNIITDQGILLMNAIDKTVFTSREDAVKALNNVEKGNSCKGGESDA